MEAKNLMNRTMCESNRVVATHFLYIMPQILWSISGISAIFILTHSFLKYGFRLLFHHNAKILMILLTIFCLIFSIDVTFVSIMQVFEALTYEDDCDVVYMNSFCSMFRRIALTCFVGVTTTQLFQMIERLVATVMIRKYETDAQWLGALLVLFSLLVAILTIEWTLWNENPLEMTTHCFSFSTSPTIGGRMYVVLYAILAVDVLILVVFMILFNHNKKKILSSGLRRKYQQHENLIVLRALFPMVVLNTVFVSLYIFIIAIGRQFRDLMETRNYRFFAINTFIFPYVSLFLSITLYLTAKKEQQRRLWRADSSKIKDANTSSQTYFNMYQLQWRQVNSSGKMTNLLHQ